MNDLRAAEALDRIEKALSRIEAASGRAVAAGSQLGELKQQHQALRTRVEGAISEIDRMLEAPEAH